MATVAEELLNDFEDSGSEHEEEGNGLDQENGETNGLRAEKSSRLDLDANEDEDEDMDGADDGDEGEPKRPVAEAEDEEEAKARVEKMQLGSVNDVRSVASLMDRLGPVLKVSIHLLQPRVVARMIV